MVDTVGILSNIYGLGNGVAGAQPGLLPSAVPQQGSGGTSQPPSPNGATPLLSSTSIAQLFGQAPATGGTDLTSQLLGGAATPSGLTTQLLGGGAGFTGVLEAYYLNRTAQAASFAVNFAEPTPSEGVSLALDGGLTARIANDTPLGEYGVAYNAETQEFLLADANGGAVTARSADGRTVDFGTGISLNLGSDFDPTQSLGLQAFQITSSQTA